MEQFISGESKKIFRTNPHTLLIGLTASVKYAWQDEEEMREDSSTLIDPSFQGNVVIQNNFFQYIYHVGCAFILHSIISSGFIPGSQSSSKRQTVFFLPVDPMDKSHKDLDVIDLSVPSCTIPA